MNKGSVDRAIRTFPPIPTLSLHIHQPLLTVFLHSMERNLARVPTFLLLLTVHPFFVVCGLEITNVYGLWTACVRLPIGRLIVESTPRGAEEGLIQAFLIRRRVENRQQTASAFRQSSTTFSRPNHWHSHVHF